MAPNHSGKRSRCYGGLGGAGTPQPAGMQVHQGLDGKGSSSLSPRPNPLQLGQLWELRLLAEIPS